MHIKSVRLKAFKRFHDLRIADLPPTAKLIVLIGQNGCGKSSLFDAFSMWHAFHSGRGSYDETYYLKQGFPRQNWPEQVQIEFHESLPADAQQRKRLVYVRSAYRHEADFTVSSFSRPGPILDDGRRIARLIDADVHVSDNYTRLVTSTISLLFDERNNDHTAREMRERLIGPVRASMRRVFGDLLLSGIGDPQGAGSFFFTKGLAENFIYKNLSGGEKAAFDLLLDFIVKREAFDDTSYCIDEPELHLHSRTQGLLLEELFALTPEKCQVWIATHSIGMLRKAMTLSERHPGSVVFLDFHDHLFDEQVELRPVRPTRSFWKRSLAIALDDLAGLVAPSQIVLCEGNSSLRGKRQNAEFDARCFRTIFEAEFPETEFLSVGNSTDVEQDRLGVRLILEKILGSTKTVRTLDRDDRSPEEIRDLQRSGARVLSRRHLESYLLDDEPLTAFCEDIGQASLVPDVLAARDKAMEASRGRGNAADDFKSALGELYTHMRRLLGLTECGNSQEAFCRDTMSQFLRSGMAAYETLKRDIFG
jgi:ABC-type nitrate/sulfonate/bicarbonate transport system ATPase subunit